ncbi:MAG: type IX secretion system membrane protein PorP/SprF [Flavobacteriales bacterium]|nr:type IX secretion system membrane protein PorP/SprF [Bacteroidota bacterium]
MTRSLILTGVCVLVAFSANAQQDPQFTQWYMEHASFNPAAAGNSDLTCISGTYRNQWEGLDRDPNTSMLTAHTFVDEAKGGVLLSVYTDALGQEENTMARLGYAYHMSPLDNGAIVSAGLAVSMFSKKLGNDWIAIDDWTQDAAIPNNATSASTIDVDFGVYIRKPGSYYAGISATHLMEQELTNLSIQPRRHLYAMAGYNYPLSGDALVLRSNVLAKTDLAATIADVNVNVLWNNMLWGGVSWRPGDAIAPTIGMEYAMESSDLTSKSQQVFRLGYSYDATTSELSNYSSGSHEIFLSYCFKFETIPMKNRYANPRFL